ncbi:unnamed protein product [Durusdinium trenchii]|uniref:Uncharacterized protein n=1 Tax=Durusdinium trenchii TaxID=1381693 RepID=A0ABP0HPG5_9DINO
MADGSLAALEERVQRLSEEVRGKRMTKLAAEDEGTKILQAADNLQLAGEERARRRWLVQTVNALLDAVPDASSPSGSPGGSSPPLLELTDGRTGTPVDDLLCAGEQLLAEVAWLCKLTEQAIANNEDAYLVSILPKMAQLEEIQLMRMLGRWAARSLPVPSELQPHLQRCVQMVQRIQDLEVKLQLILEALDRPHHSEAFVQKACGVYLQLLEYLENPTSGQVEQLTKQLVSERKEVKSDIAFVKDRLTSLRKRHRILRCLAPSRTAVAAMTAKELRLCLQIHELPDRGFRERQDIIDELEKEGILQPE